MNYKQEPCKSARKVNNSAKRKILHFLKYAKLIVGIGVGIMKTKKIRHY